MDNLQTRFETLYKNFNERKIDLVISEMVDNVKWANGMEGGFVYGHKGVKEYWTRQFTMISATVTPVQIEMANDVVTVKVHQVDHDMNGKLLADETLYHYFRLDKNKIAEFTIGDKVKN